MFYDILDIRNAFLDYKNINLKNSKNWDFFQGAGAVIGSCKGLVHDFFVFCVFQDILDIKNALVDYKNINLKQWKNWDFSKGVSSWFLWKIGNFSILLF